MRPIAKIILAAAFSLSTALVLSCDNKGPGLKPGDSPGDFRLETSSQERFYLNQQRGRVTMLVFWATTCLGCKEEVAALKTLHAEWRKKGLSLAAVCIDPDNTDLLASIVKDIAPDFPILLDRDAKLFRSWRLTEVPATVILDREGKVVMVKIGYDPAAGKQVKTKVAQLLAGVPSA